MLSRLTSWSFAHLGNALAQQTRIAALEARAAHARANWAKGDREHFLKGWMPRAANPRAGKPAEKVVPSEEPKWWADFVGECYPNARKMTYGQIAARLPDVIAEGHRWAASRGSV
jgi:hypothetical protein